MPKNNTVTLRINRRELATILAALRFHQDENLQADRGNPDQFIKEIATDSDRVKPLDFREVSKLCERLNIGKGQSVAKGLVIEPPPKETGSEPLYRVVYVIDVNAVNQRKAAEHVHRLMSDHDSQPPVLEIIDHQGKSVSIDLSEKTPA